MKTAIVVDEVGRLVLPKNIRLAIGLTGRAKITGEVVGRSVHLTPPEQRSGPVSRKRGRIVYAGQLPKGWHSGERSSKCANGGCVDEAISRHFGLTRIRTQTLIQLFQIDPGAPCLRSSVRTQRAVALCFLFNSGDYRFLPHAVI
jgi:hypothetical protein